MKNKIIAGSIALSIITLTGIIYYILKYPEAGSPTSHGGDLGFEMPGFSSPEENRISGKRELLSNWLDYAQYPPDSRPLAKSMEQLVHPWNAVPLVVVANSSHLFAMVEEMRKQGKTNEEINQATHAAAENQPAVIFNLSKHTVTPGDTLILTLQLKSSNENDHFPIQIRSADLFNVTGGNARLGSLDFNDSGISPDTTGGDGVYSASWKIPGPDKKYWGTLQAVVTASAAPLRDPVTWSAVFFSSSVTPGEFTGEFQESLENGSLMIRVGVNGAKEYRCKILANLWSVDENVPTHIADWTGVIKPGHQFIPLTFFGKIFRDEGYEGKFRLTDLRGTCDNLPFPPSWLDDPTKVEEKSRAPQTMNEPVTLYFPFTPRTYTTSREYDNREFSDAVWQSAQKDLRTKALETALSKQL